MCREDQDEQKGALRLGWLIKKCVAVYASRVAHHSFFDTYADEATPRTVLNAYFIFYFDSGGRRGPDIL